MFLNRIELVELRERMNLGFQPILVDVRTPSEFAHVHAVGAVSIPLDGLDIAGVATNCRSTDGRIYILCHSGFRAAAVCHQLTSAGVDEVFVVQGGMQAWQSVGLPVVNVRGVISLERQVRIGAGSLVLLGCLLAWLVNPHFIALLAFIGAGLVFAGVTDICGMGILLGKLPWNAHASAASSESCCR